MIFTDEPDLQTLFKSIIHLSAVAYPTRHLYCPFKDKARGEAYLPSIQRAGPCTCLSLGELCCVRVSWGGTFVDLVHPPGRGADEATAGSGQTPMCSDQPEHSASHLPSQECLCQRRLDLRHRGSWAASGSSLNPAQLTD